MKFKWLLNTMAIMLLIAIGAIGVRHYDAAMAAQEGTEKIESMLLERFTTESTADFIVRFSPQADLSPAYSMDWDARGEFVYNTLRDTAASSQANAKALLDARGLTYQTYIAGNDLFVAGGTLAVANDLAALSEVYFIRATRTYYIDPVVEVRPLENITWAGDLLANRVLTTVGGSTDVLDWGITDTSANQFWTNFGVQGDGMVVANIDTGVQWNHPALDQAFKCGANPADPACWADPSNVCGGSACDNNGHGTHTMGTMVGDDDPGLAFQVGMAPNAQWIACKGCESNSCSDTALNACADWILAPGGNTANRPNVVNNSWGGGGGDTWYLAKVQAWRAAGVFPAFSSGNSTGCGTMGSPGDYQESFASTGHDIARNHDFSSGPSAFGHDPYTKPNISAPGVNICSAVPTNSWSCGYSGTSMASPHAAGAVALLWSCNPSLVGQIDQTFQLLQNNADTPPAGTCGAPPDGQGNYTFGYGYLNIQAAGVAGCGGVATGHLTGHVRDTGGNPIEGATVNAVLGIEGNQIQATTDPTGYYSMTLAAGTYNVTASKTGYSSQTVNGVVIADDGTTVQDFALSSLWTLGPDLSACFDLTRLDGEFYPGTGLVYFLGGRSGATTVGNIYVFNPVTGICADTGAVMPNPISNYTVNLVNNGAADLLCTFGGRQADGTVTLNVQCYNPNTNTAGVVTNLPAAWTGYTPGAQVVVDNMVYIFGGYNGGTLPYMIARTEKYNPVTNSFTQLGDLNLARSYIMATSVDGIIYAFGGDTYDGASLIAQTMAEKMDPAVGTWNDAGVTDLPVAGDEGRAFGFDSGAPYLYANQIVLATMAQWSGASAEVVLYDVATNTYDQNFPDVINARRNHAGVFVPLYTADPTDGLPGIWVFGGYLTGDNPPYAPSEFLTVSAPDIVVTGPLLDVTILPDTITSIHFTITNQGTVPLVWNLMEVPAVAGYEALPAISGSPVDPLSRSAPEIVGRPAGLIHSGIPFAPVIDEGFEGGVMPPTGWMVLQTNPRQTWKIGVVGTPYEGIHFADVEYDDILAPQDEVLLSPELTISSGILDFWSNGSVYWCRDTYDNCDLNIWIVVGAWDGGADDDIFVGKADDAWTDNWVWSHLNFNLAPLLPGGPVRIGFQYIGLDGAQIGLDAILLDVPSDVPWLSENPTSGTVAPGSSQVVTVTFNSTGLAFGQYLASLDIYSNDPDVSMITLPVTLTVAYQIHLPITFK